MSVTNKVREVLFNIKDLTFEPAIYWYTYVVLSAPRDIWIVKGVRLVAALLADEVLAVTKTKLIKVTMSKYFNPTAPFAT